MKILIVLSLLFFSHKTFALDSCKSFFALEKEQKLSVVELAAIYHQNYINSPKGKADLERMQDLLSAKYEIRKYPNGISYFQVVYEPKAPVKESAIEEIILKNPNITIIYDISPKRKD